MGKWVNITLNILPKSNMKISSQYFFYFCLGDFINLMSNYGISKKKK